MKKESQYGVPKGTRLLSLYTKLMQGEQIDKTKEAERFGVTLKTIQRDIEDLRAFFQERGDESGELHNIYYDPSGDSYYLTGIQETWLNGAESYAVCKILLESHAFEKEEMDRLINKLMHVAVRRRDFNFVKDLIANEKHYYDSGRIGQPQLQLLWTAGNAIRKRQVLQIHYLTPKKKRVIREIRPIGCLFSDHNFYLLAQSENKNDVKSGSKDVIWQEDKISVHMHPDVYRIDRIEKMEMREENFEVLYRHRFEEGEYRKRVRKMHAGRLNRLTFWTKNENLEEILFEMPTARVRRRKDTAVEITAEIFTGGMEEWAMSKGWIDCS